MSGEQEAEEALLRVTLFALDEPLFLNAWEAVVREGADYVTAEVAGARMAGHLEGEVLWDASIPCPDEISAEDAELAYRLAVRLEAEKRLAAMSARNAGGLGLG